ncbi:MAG: fibronectin type III domain-containing protein, partial [Bacteroidales bacterium]|nr:fibronectin type III domain-containing protein [Bacteroidales bacterium]
MKKHIFTSAFFCFLSCVLLGQNTAKLHLFAEHQSSQIRLRWAIDCPLTWQLANRYGYTLERSEILDRHVVMDFPRRRILNEMPIKPVDSTVWMERFDQHQSYAILSQALFGEDFETSFQVGHPLFQAINQVQQNEQRFSFALLAADQHFEAACLAGLGWVDSVVEPHKTYLYRLYINSPDTLILGDTAKILIAPNEQKRFPKITNVFSETSDKSVFLSWGIKHFSGIYTDYIVEKSTDKNRFINAEAGHAPSLQGENAVFIDSLETNNKPYFFRIRGVNIFGTVGPPSDIIEVVGIPDFSAYPENLTIRENGKNIILQWTFDEIFNKDLSHFWILSQSNLNAKSIVLSNVSAKQRSFNLNVSKLEPSNYFSVVAIYKNGQQRSSYPYFYQVVDTIPPSAPKGFFGVADSLGIVKLFWKKNTESDLDGYRIFRSNQAFQDVVQISEMLITDTVFFDTISTNTDKSVFYQLIAIDKRGNKSDFSAKAEVKRVSKFPPAAKFVDSVAAFSAMISEPLSPPKITGFADRDNRRIVLNWQASYAVSEVQIFRKKNDDDWYLLEVFEPTKN